MGRSPFCRSSAAQVALALAQSAEGRALHVQSLYQQFLHRGADAAGLAASTQALAAGQTLEQVGAAIVASPEYYQESHKGRVNTADWVQSAFRDELQREPGPADLAIWTGFLGP